MSTPVPVQLTLTTQTARTLIDKLLKGITWNAVAPETRRRNWQQLEGVFDALKEALLGVNIDGTVTIPDPTVLGGLKGYNSEAALTAPRYGLAAVVAPSWTGTAVKFQRPTAIATSDVCIIGQSTGIGPHGSGDIYADGVHWVTMDTLTGLVIGDRVGTGANLWTATKETLGPLYVVAIDTTNTRALVLFDRGGGAGGATLTKTIYNDSGGALSVTEVVRGVFTADVDGNEKVQVAATSGWEHYYVIVDDTIADDATGLAQQDGELTALIGTGGVTAGERADVVAGEKGIATAQGGPFLVRLDCGDGTCKCVLIRDRLDNLFVVDNDDTATGPYPTLLCAASYAVSGTDGAVTINRA